MKLTDNDAFYEFIKQYDSDSGHHTVGEVEYYLVCDDKPYEGIVSHREALSAVFDRQVELSIADIEDVRSRLGDDAADKLSPLVFDVDKAQPVKLDPKVFFYCPNIVRIDYSCSVFYDAEWVILITSLSGIDG